MDKIALTGLTPFTGCSTIANVLERVYGYTYIPLSLRFVEQFRAASDAVSNVDIFADKERYRTLIHGFVKQNEPALMDIICNEILRTLNPTIVVEKVRTNYQVARLRELGFYIVQIDRPEEHVRRTAERKGHTPETWAALLAGGSEGKVTDIDEPLTNSFTCDTIAKYLINLEDIHDPITGDRIV